MPTLSTDNDAFDAGVRRRAPATRSVPLTRRLAATLVARIRIWQREPLVRFMAIGGLIFLGAHVAQPSGHAAARRIVVDSSVDRHIAQLTRAQSGLTPGPEQLRKLESDYVDDEVRYREALRLGLDRDDEIVRRRLIQKMMFLQRDLSTPVAPTEQALHDYYDAHAADFRTAPSLAFEQIYFSPDVGGWSNAQARASKAAAHLHAQQAAQTASDGDASPVVIPAGETTREQAMALFGDTPVVDVLFSSRSDTWSEPVRSGYGWHLVRVTLRTAPQIPAFEQVRPQVETAWRDAETVRNEKRELADLRALYQINRVQ